MALPPEEIAYQTEHIHEDQGPKIIGISVFLVVLAAGSVVLRFVARMVRHMELGWDDWLCVPALLLTGCMCTVNIISVKFGLGKHLLATDPTKGYKILQAGYFLSLTYALTHFFLKMAILFLYIRIFTLNIKWFKYAIYATIFYVSGWSIGMVVTILSNCRPISFFWERANLSRETPAVGVCTIDVHATEISTSVLNTFADVVLLVLSISMVWRLQLNTSKKLGVMGIFLVGAFACVASILRFVSTLTLVSHDTDTTWNAVGVYLWTSIEAAIGLMCACFPVIGPLFAVFRTKVAATMASKTRGTKGSKVADGESLVSADASWTRIGTGSRDGTNGVEAYPLSAKLGGISRTDEYTVSRSK